MYVSCFSSSPAERRYVHCLTIMWRTPVTPLMQCFSPRCYVFPWTIKANPWLGVELNVPLLIWLWFKENLRKGKLEKQDLHLYLLKENSCILKEARVLKVQSSGLRLHQFPIFHCRIEHVILHNIIIISIII